MLCVDGGEEEHVVAYAAADRQRNEISGLLSFALVAGGAAATGICGNCAHTLIRDHEKPSGSKTRPARVIKVARGRIII